MGAMPYGGVTLFISDKLEYQVTLCGPKELKFLLVSVCSTNYVNKSPEVF